MSGRPTPLSRTAFRTRSSLQVDTNRSALKSVKKHFPNDAAWWTKRDITALKTDTEPRVRSAVSHPQERFLDVGVVLVSCCLHTLSDCFSQHALFLYLPQVLIGLLTQLLNTRTEISCSEKNISTESQTGRHSLHIPCGPPAAELQEPWRRS